MRHLACIGVGLAVLAAGCRPPPSAQRARLLAPEQEVDIGRAAAPRLEERLGGRLDALAVQAYVRTVGERIDRAASGGEWPLRVTVLDSPRAGAFSLPGGPVFLTRGLLALLDSEGALAAVIAHQVAHAGAGHDLRRLGEAPGPRVLADAAAAAALVREGAPLSPAAAAALDRLVVAATEVGYSAEMEAEADALALDYMVAAGYHPGEMVRVAALFESMQGGQGSEFLGVHANPAGRAAGISAAAGRKYLDRGGRIGRPEYQREVLARLKS